MRAGAVWFSSNQLKWHSDVLPNSLGSKMARNKGLLISFMCSMECVDGESLWECFKEKPQTKPHFVSSERRPWNVVLENCWSSIFASVSKII